MPCAIDIFYESFLSNNILEISFLEAYREVLPRAVAAPPLFPPAVNAVPSPARPPSGTSDSPYLQKNTRAFVHAMLALFCGGFATFALLYCVQPMMPGFSQSFGLSAAQSSLVLSIATGPMALGLLITGPISDAVGRKPIMVVALFTAAVCTLAGALMPNWEGLLAMRLLVGLSLSGLAAVGMTYLAEEIDPAHMGYAMGLYISGNAMGGMSGRLISGVMIDFVSWRVVLLVLGVIALAAATLFARRLPPSRHFEPSSLRPRDLYANFALHFRDPGLPWLFLEGFLLMGAFVTLFNYIGYHLLEAPYALSQAVVGLVSVVYLAGIYSSARVGALADLLGRRRVFWMVMVVMGAGLLLTLAETLWLVLPGVLIFTFGFFGAHSVASSWVGRRALHARGQASSLYLASYYLGSSVAGTLGGLMWQWGGWEGVVGFIGLILAAGLAVAAKLARLAPLQAASTQR